MEAVIKRVNLNYQHMKMIEYFMNNSVYSYRIVEALPDYYKKTLEQRQFILGAHDIRALCKTIVLENTLFNEKYESKYYKRHYCALVQYVTDFNGEKISKYMKNLQNCNSEEKLSNKYFKFRVAKEDYAYEMSGYTFNCITPFLMKSEEIEILFPSTLTQLEPKYFWVGGGEVELKVGISIEDFQKLYGKRLHIFDFMNN